MQEQQEEGVFLLCYIRAIWYVTVPVLSSLVTMGVTLPRGIDMPHTEATRSYGIRMGFRPRGFHLLG